MITMKGKYETRDGRVVRILCVDGPHPDYPIIGFIQGLYCPIQWNRDGRISPLETFFNNDLVPVSTKVEMWAVVYADGDYRTAVAGRFLFSTEAFAQGAADCENREHPSLTHDKAHVALVTWEG